jgi:serine protease Do
MSKPRSKKKGDGLPIRPKRVSYATLGENELEGPGSNTFRQTAASRAPVGRWIWGMIMTLRIGHQHWSWTLLLAWLVLLPVNRVSSDESPTLDGALALERAVVNAIAATERSVVAIARFRTDGPARPGLDDWTVQGWPGGVMGPMPELADRMQAPDEFAAGVVIDRGGYILTNFHVLGDPDKNRYVVMAGRRPLEAVQVLTVDQVQAGDPWTDLAVIKVDADDLEPITFGDADRLRKGQFVISLGNPYNIARDGEVSASWGIISNLGRRIPRDETGGGTPPRERLYHYGGLIQTDAKLNMGTSGGALINLSGEMIGLTTAMASLEGFEKSLGFAIPVDDSFRTTVETLKSGRKAEFGFLGVEPRDLSAVMRRSGRQGVELARVVPATPAAQAGLRPGDLITRVNDVPLYDSLDMMCQLGKLAAGSTVRLAVQRGADATQRGRLIRTSVNLSKKHIPLADRAYSIVPDPTWRGMGVDYATAVVPATQLQQLLQIDRAGNALGVSQVEPESVAWQAGIRPGNLLTHVNGQRVTTPDQFFETVETLEGDVPLRLVTGELTIPGP